MGIKPGKDVLYLGCATGTTPSHISDIIEDGTIFCLDFAPRVMRDIVFVCEERKNMVPIMADASLPQEYAHRIKPVDVVFQDIAQRDQVEIFLKNCDAFLKSGGFGLLAIKAKSIDQKRKPKKIFNECRDKLERAITIVDYRELHPFEEDHCFFVVKKK